MGRTATFDRADVIESARDLFWSHGYEATAIPDLERATGLKRSSLYHAFGSKKGLFDEAVENYLTEKVRPLLARITDESSTPNALATYFETLAKSVSTADSHPGCLLIAAANSPVGADPTVSAAISGYYDELFVAFRTGVGRLRPHLTASEADGRTRALVALTISALALARTNKTLALANLHAAQELLDAKG
ncbi:MAG: TetR/AcrR family transcriptional regulator [Rothia sp. (in: high G+C Gram-positive bacteria)]|uniref:TetR/AcrR family transcriptional regulator n=1 Tax=Rothia sp. (in: high G+C Gram-positive bacteria) TaxID=1885016 RepID=UPI002702807C|nr:TetR/AcrR family transcriptional regulator [Rothia sp. (in: high G+C Gram-positive bacteria)]